MEKKGILLRLPQEMKDELERAADAEGRSVTELLTQGAVIRMRMPDKAKLPMLLEKLGYQERNRPGRPRGLRPAAAPGNGSGPGPAEPGLPPVSNLPSSFSDLELE